MRIFLMGATPSFQVSAADSVLRKLELTGGNTGNQVIAYGLLKSLSCTSLSWDHSIGPARVAREFDMIVIAAANFLFEGFDFSGMANFIEATNLPCMMVGVGAQSNNYSADIALHPGTMKLMKIVSERSALIGVRGEFTVEVLARLGIHNVQITGCPSYYMGGTAGFPLTLPSWRDDFHLAVNSSRDVIKHAFNATDMLKMSRRIGEIAINIGADFIAQTEQDEISVAEDTDDAADALGRLKAFYEGTNGSDKIGEWGIRHMRVFWRVEDWSRCIKTYDFVFGTRFHGCMIALQEGVPACIICHDTRTSEMAEFFELPRISLSKAIELRPEDLYELVDVESVSRRYSQLLPRFREFLASNNAPLKLETV